jgi:type II secretory pathway component GspD/PulD (secretin)
MKHSQRVALLAAAFALAQVRPEPAGAQTTLSLDVRGLDIYDAVRLLSTEAGVNLVLDGSVEHRPVTLRLENVTFDQALAALAQTNDLVAVKLASVTYLGTVDAMNRRYPSNTALGTRTAVVGIRNADPADVAKALGDALPKGTLVVPDRRASTILVAGSAIALQRAREVIAALDRTTGIRSASLAMRFVKAGDALKALQATLTIVPPASAFSSDQQNQIVLTGTSDFIAQAEAIVADVDRPGRQVRYEVRVTDISPTESSNVGFMFGGVDETGQEQAGSGSTFTTFLGNSLAINATINALVTKGEAQILARPTLCSLNNVPASLLVGEQYPIVYFDARTGTQQVQFVNVGVNLNVTPTVGADGVITTDLETDYSQVTGTIANFPIITTRKAQSTLRVRDGETIVIAGLFSDVDSRSLSKVPFLGDIPFIGEIFRNRARNRSRDEVVFLITPHLVVDGSPANADPPAGVRSL